MVVLRNLIHVLKLILGYTVSIQWNRKQFLIGGGGQDMDVARQPALLSNVARQLSWVSFPIYYASHAYSQFTLRRVEQRA